MASTHTLFPELTPYIQSLDYSGIESERLARLQQVVAYIEAAHAQGAAAELVFICTHNSRRSHFGQIWAKVLADFKGVAPVHTYSGGTEATAFNPNAIAALRAAGIQITGEAGTANPRYEVTYGADVPSLTAWSKVYTDDANPKQGFCAIMTCSEADEACPMVFGAGARVSLPYEDPKKSDGTPEQAATYAARCREVATEMAWIFAQL